MRGDIGDQLGAVLHIGWIAQDQVETSPERIRPAGLHEARAVAESQPLGIAACDGQ